MHGTTISDKAGTSTLAPRGPATLVHAPRRILAAGVLAFALAAAAAPLPAAAGTEPPADVVVIVDTSKSMADPGMDPERTSLLVSWLLADILPGDLAVVRLLDLVQDRADLPRRETGERSTCAEDGASDCQRIEPIGDWEALARDNLLGVVQRERRGEQAFKDRLLSHLEQDGNNSYFYLSFRAAEGVFARNGSPPDARTVVWLSDGRDEAPGRLELALADLRAAGTRIDTVIFGRGDPSIPRELGLSPVQVGSPQELMGAFAQVFRQIMRAPYRIDHRVDAQPRFEVRPNVETLWVVVYGDPSLEQVQLRDADGGVHPADFAADRLVGAGAYRVARIDDPAAGGWQVETTGGGPQSAYAVIQRSSLAPALLAPVEAMADAETRLVAGIIAGADATPLDDPQALDGARIRALIDGLEVSFNDAGEGADAQAGDGRFSAFHRFRSSGRQVLELMLDSPFARQRSEASVMVRGIFRWRGADPSVRFGTLAAPTPAPVCKPVPLPDGALEHQGTVPVRLAAAGEIPDGFRLWVRIGGEELRPGDRLDWPAGAPLEACLALARSAPTHRADGEPALVLTGGEGADQALSIRLHWQVQGLGFWQRWGWLIGSLLVALAAVIITLGFVLPKRFPKTLAISFVPERDDVDDSPPQPVHSWSGTGSGFYRNARAFLHRDFRISGRAAGALAGLFALGTTSRVRGHSGLRLYREDIGGDWTEVAAEGEMVRPGEVYRIGDGGPFFRLSAR
jgi:hypothetical protein